MQISTLVRCIVASCAPTSDFQSYGLSFTQSCTIAVTRAIAFLLPARAASMPIPSQRSECNHMYQLGWSYGFARQLMSPLPLPTWYAGCRLHWNVSSYSRDTGLAALIPLYPGQVYFALTTCPGLAGVVGFVAPGIALLPTFGGGAEPGLQAVCGDTIAVIATMTATTAAAVAKGSHCRRLSRAGP